MGYYYYGYTSKLDFKRLQNDFTASVGAPVFGILNNSSNNLQTSLSNRIVKSTYCWM